MMRRSVQRTGLQPYVLNRTFDGQIWEIECVSICLHVMGGPELSAGSEDVNAASTDRLLCAGAPATQFNE
jgi:hypothetical protein